MFKRDHHIRIANILQSLDASLLLSCSCYFGGGTAIVLSHGEYRESADIDFCVSDQSGYRKLRQLVTGKDGIQAIAKQSMKLRPMRDVRTDQYGIRTLLEAGKTPIKFEIIFEARVQLDTPDPANEIYGIRTLTPIDMIATKLLANSDRWSDDSVFSRDLVDLAMINPSSSEMQTGLNKAAQAYGASVRKDLLRAIEKLEARQDRLEEIMTALKIKETPKVLLWKKIRALKKFGKLNPTSKKP